MPIARRQQDKRKELAGDRPTSPYVAEPGKPFDLQTRMNDERSEKELVRLACEGDREAYWRLVEPHLRVVLSTARAILMNSADAEEVAQEALLKALRNICQFRREAKFSTWLVQIAINESRRRLRRHRKHLHCTLDEITDGHSCKRERLADKGEAPSKMLERKELGDVLQTAIASLPQKYREVLTLRDIKQLSTKETARVLGLTLQNVKIRLLRARLQMRDALAPHFDGLSATPSKITRQMDLWE